MLISRLITAFILLSAFIAASFWLPGRIFALITLAAFSLAAVEWAKLTGYETKISSWLYGAGVLVTGLLLWFALPLYPPETYFQLIDRVMTIMLPFWFLLVPLMLFSSVWARFRLTLKVSGFLVLISTWLAMIWLKEIHLVWFFFPLVTIWISDSAAYFIGRRFGKHKLAPSISPGKTIEGALGALIIVTSLGTVAFMYGHDYIPGAEHISLWQIPVVLAVLVIMGIIGDLFESMLKRRANVKDSGTLLPGHGGILDRIDALLPVLPIVAWLSYRIVCPMYLTGLTNWSF